VSDDIYQAPDSDLLEGKSDLQPFYVVSPKKFVALFIATLGIYHVYWFYKNWALYKAAGGKGGWPVMRAIFSIFFAHSLFARIDERLKENGLAFLGSPGNLALAYVVLSIASNIVDRLSSKSIGEPFTDILGLVVLPFLCWTLYKVQLSVNIACGDEAGEQNETFTPLNYLWLGIGFILWALVFIGMYEVMIGIPE